MESTWFWATFDQKPSGIAWTFQKSNTFFQRTVANNTALTLNKALHIKANFDQSKYIPAMLLKIFKLVKGPDNVTHCYESSILLHLP